MTSGDLTDRANDILDRAMRIDEAVANAHAFRVLLGNVVGRYFTAEEQSHASAVHMVRAGILRAQVGAVMAILDSFGDNRASLGHIVEKLRNEELRTLLHTPRRYQNAAPNPTSVAGLLQSYDDLINSEEFKRIKRLRNEEIAHLLVLDTPTPVIQNHEISALQDRMEALIWSLFEGTGLGKPPFAEKKAELVDRARLFWDTYFRGMRLDN